MNRLIILLALLLLPAAAVAAELKQGPSARVVVVVDGETVELDNRMVVRPVGIQAPKLPLGRPWSTWSCAPGSRSTTRPPG